MNLVHYLKFFLFHAVGLFATAALLAGGKWTSAGFVAILIFFIVGDAISGDDTATPKYKHPWVLTVQLWAALPLLMVIVFCFLWSVSSVDVFGIGAFLSNQIGYDLLAAREATGLIHHISGVLLTGLMIGVIGTVPAHELTHRTWEPVSRFIGRWLLAFSYDTVFAIEHVYGHHRYVSTELDPATAPRGRNVYHHVVASTIDGNISAWKIEKRRLKRRGYGLFSMHNAVLRGYLMSVVLTIAAFAMGGLTTMLFFVAAALWGKALLEIVNYMEHYGMVRLPDTPVKPRHSWNTNKRISSWALFNLTRHSHHHAQAETAYQDLKPMAKSPMMISGYLTTIVVAMIPPLWHKMMTPKVLEWDQRYASKEEKLLAEQANQRSGIKALINANAN